MKVSTQRLPESQVLLEIEVDPAQMEQSLNKAYRRLAKNVEVPGFRKGKTPRNILERHLGRDRLVHEAIDILIPEAYNQAMDDHDVDAIGQPSVEVVTEEPLSFKATVPVRPTVDLGDYQALRVERTASEPDEADVDNAIEELRQRYAVQQPVERVVKTGDIIRADVRIVIEDEEVYKDEDAEIRLRDGATILLPGFAEGVVGAKKGETREIKVTTPEGEGKLAGKTGIASVTIQEVKEEVLPEANDQFASEVGEGFASLEALKNKLRDDLLDRIKSQAEERFRNEAVEALAKNAATVEFPPVLVEREIERELEEQARATGQTVEAYLELIKKTPEQIKEDLTPTATERVRRFLVLSKLTEEEEITVESSEVDAEVEKLVESAGEHSERMRQLFSQQGARGSIESSLVTKKTVDRLTALVDPDGAAAAEADTTEEDEPADEPEEAAAAITKEES
ncbi:MAG: trigger factor [Chloroflexi bacterium]|nr:trigger factor [Chloroflexota bacterium]